MTIIEAINCTNYFNKVGCQRLQEALDSGKSIQIYIDCIGRSTTIRETSIYEEWLKETYGERLGSKMEGYTSTVYYLK